MNSMIREKLNINPDFKEYYTKDKNYISIYININVILILVYLKRQFSLFKTVKFLIWNKYFFPEQKFTRSVY